MKINNIKGRKAYKLLETYEGVNPYILNLKETLAKKPNTILTDTQNSYIIKNFNFEPKEINKVIELTDFASDEIKKTFRTTHYPSKLMVLILLGETDKAFHVIAKLSTKGEPIMIFLPKKGVITDFKFEPMEVNINFDRYNERLKERRGYTLLDYQKEGIKFLLERKGAILADEMGLAKGLRVNELVSTPNGYVEIKDINVGDYVTGSNGKPTKVIGVFPMGLREIYRVHFNDGFYLEVTDDHLWSVCKAKSNNKEGKYKVLSTKEMLDKEGKFEEKHSNGRTYYTNTYYKQSNGNNQWQIPILSNPIEYNNNDSEIKIDPYLLGLSIGDGHFNGNGNKVTIGLNKHDFDDVMSKYKNNLFNDVDIKDDSRNDVRSVTLNLGNQITETGLNGTRSHNKFIPELYKYSSIENRISLLKGLMDSDGSANSNKKTKNRKGGYTCCTYASISERLVDDIVELVQSLGGIARKSDKKHTGYYYKDGEKVICNDYFRLTIKFNDINPFNLKRKQNIFENVEKYKCSRFITNIENINVVDEAICIKVEAEDSLFVANHGIITHNTLTSIVGALETRFKRILVICPASVKINWQRELSTFTDNTVIVEGRVWNQARFTIINYEILKNFHTLDSKIDPDDPQTYIARDLVNGKFDLIIIDEAHNLRNTQTVSGEIVSELCTKYGDPYVWLLSGTPVANRPKDFYNLLRMIKSPVADHYPHYMQRYCDAKTFTRVTAGGKRIKTYIANGATNLDELAKRTKHLILRRLKSDELDMPEKQIIRMYHKLSDKARDEYNSVWEDYLIKRKEEEKRGNVKREMVELGLLRKFLAMEAVEYTYETAMEAIEQGKKVVIFTTYHEEQEMLAEKFGKICVRHNGRMSPREKQLSVDSFQEKDKIKVFIGNVLSAGVGITLTAGTVTIFNSYSWVTGDNAQAEDRCWRLGQKNNCIVYYQVFENTISEKVIDTLTKKADIINQIIGSDEEMEIYNNRIMDLVIESE